MHFSSNNIFTVFCVWQKIAWKLMSKSDYHLVFENYSIELWLYVKMSATINVILMLYWCYPDAIPIWNCFVATMRYRWHADVIPIWYLCDIVVILLLYRCDIDVIPMFYCCYINVISMRHRCDMDVIPMWYTCDKL